MLLNEARRSPNPPPLTVSCTKSAAAMLLPGCTKCDCAEMRGDWVAEPPRVAPAPRNLQQLMPFVWIGSTATTFCSSQFPLSSDNHCLDWLVMVSAASIASASASVPATSRRLFSERRPLFLGTLFYLPPFRAAPAFAPAAPLNTFFFGAGSSCTTFSSASSFSTTALGAGPRRKSSSRGSVPRYSTTPMPSGLFA